MKKERITFRQIEKQKRYLNDTLIKLYQRFIQEHRNVKLSYVCFSRLRPFWILQKTVEQRNMCLCKLHENVSMRIEKLKQVEAISEKDPGRVGESLFCSISNKECVYGDCRKYNSTTVERLGTQVTYSQWSNKTETISGKDGDKTVQKHSSRRSSVQ